MTHYYEILGLQPGASKAEIKQAYRRLCLECHPDKLPPDTPKKARQIVEEHFKQINEAYAYLMEHPSVLRASQNFLRITEEFSRYCLALHF
ncbi:J domain-containing protein [Thermosynechococcus sp.]|uniref:J domain-containing protein n=1 Tax=Thermosynechococcus sp. TaxID=2814275 RepID=UPI00391C1803